MEPIVIGAIVCAFSFGGALLGMWLNSALPEHHLDADSKATVQIGIGLVATMTALVLGLVTASAKSSFDAVDTAVKQTAIDILTLDRILARYGPETGAIRKDLKTAMEVRIDTIWPQGTPSSANLDPIGANAASHSEALVHAIRRLTPRDDEQRALQTRAVNVSESLLQSRWLVLAGTEASIPTPFLVILVSWLTIMFASFGMYAPRNGTVIAVLFVSALSVASAVFLVLEMDAPFTGLLRVSPEPWRFVHSHLGR